MAYNNLSVTITEAKKALILQKINEIKQELPFLVNLSAEERKRLRSIGTKRVAYVDDVLMIAKQNPQHIPASVDLAEYEKDATLYHDLSELFLSLSALFEGIENTAMASGGEAVRESDKIYGILKNVARGDANLNAALKKIAKHFEKKRKPKDTGSDTQK